jgi:hypothetical protein
MIRAKSTDDPALGTTKTKSKFQAPVPPKGFEQLYRELERIVVSHNDSAGANANDELASLRMQIDSLTAAAERSGAERRDLERCLHKMIAREALFRRTLEWYADGPFGQLALEVLRQPASAAAARIEAERELFFEPLEHFYCSSRSGRVVRIVFEHERNAKRFYDSVSYFLPKDEYFGKSR